MALATLSVAPFVVRETSLDELAETYLQRQDALALEEDLDQLFPDDPDLVQRRAARGYRGWR